MLARDEGFNACEREEKYESGLETRTRGRPYPNCATLLADMMGARVWGTSNYSERASNGIGFIDGCEHLVQN